MERLAVLTPRPYQEGGYNYTRILEILEKLAVLASRIKPSAGGCTIMNMILEILEKLAVLTFRRIPKKMISYKYFYFHN